MIAQHFIQSVVVTHNGRTVLDVQWSQAVSRDPFLDLRIKGTEADDRVTVNWVDNYLRARKIIRQPRLNWPTLIGLRGNPGIAAGA